MSDAQTRHGILIDFTYCTGCHSCEVACKKVHDLGKGVYGIRILKDGPHKVGEKEYEWFNVPVPGKLCDLCAERTEAGKLPLCVQSCQSKCMAYGTAEELAKKAAETTRSILYTLD